MIWSIQKGMEFVILGLKGDFQNVSNRKTEQLIVKSSTVQSY